MWDVTVDGIGKMRDVNYQRLLEVTDILANRV